VYFQTGRLPPAGLNNFFSHRVQVPPDVAARLRIVPQSQLQQWMEEGRFDAAVVWDEDPAVTWLAKRYVQRAVVQDMIIFERTAGAR
jgi:3-polyprenyl-4-hydroxybenzoate decarboxylase